MTLEEFAAFIKSGMSSIYVWPYAIAECRCGDINCKGWRLVPAPLPVFVPVERFEDLVGV